MARRYRTDPNRKRRPEWAARFGLAPALRKSAPPCACPKGWAPISRACRICDITELELANHCAFGAVRHERRDGQTIVCVADLERATAHLPDIVSD